MADIIVMPQMNLSMEEGVLTKWCKNQGDTVKLEEVLCSVENEKETGDITSSSEGILVKILGEEGVRYKINVPIAIIAAPGEDWSETESKAQEMIQGNGSAQQIQNIQFDKSVLGVKMLPKIRKVLKEKGIDVEDILALFPDRKITEKEIALYEEQYNNAKGQASEGDIVERMTSMRQTISKAMKESCEKTARLTNFMEVDMTSIVNKVAEEKTKGRKVSFTAVVIKACAKALEQHPVIRTELNEQKFEIILKKSIHIGCAIDVEGGLIVPVIRDADKKDVLQITGEMAEYAQKIKDHTLEASERDGGTFTVSSVGMFDVDFFTPIINYPQTAILGVGKIKVLPRYADDTYTTIAPRHVMEIGLTYDHRVIDGAPASRFLKTIRDILEQDIQII